MEEYDRLDAAFYDYYSLGVEGDALFYVAEVQKVGGPVLEIGCGTGRILLPIAESGIAIVGLDRAPSMLTVLKQKLSQYSPATHQRVELVEGDMRHFTLERRFPLIIIPYRAFLHLLTPKDQRRALTNIREHLTDDGQLIFNIFDPNLAYITARLASASPSLKKDSEFLYPDTGHRVIVWESFQCDPEQQRVEGYFIFEELDDDGRVVAKTYSPLTLRWVYRYEMRYLLELCGYKVEALYGDFQRGPFHAGGEQIWVVRKG